ncbi:hypothetical protein HYW87_02030 [Candidatus Roizmanbacteria bacterium]|nr:hypothetical protein [Candidatus Roizmanbacteria bacterium]
MRRTLLILGLIITSSILSALLTFTKPKTLIKSKASERVKKEDYAKNEPKSEYSPNELIITLKSSSPPLSSSTKNFDKEAVPFSEVEKSTLPPRPV